MTSSDGMKRANHLFQFEDGEAMVIDQSLVDGLRTHYVGDGDLGTRIATSMWVEIVALNARYDINFLNILQPIFDLENDTNLSRTKPATPFRREPLIGLWHKHYFAARFTAGNVQAGLGKTGIRKILIDIMGGPPDGTKTITKEHIKEFARRVVMDPLQHRSAAGKRTGEWIVYLQRPDGNRYLKLGTHLMPDQHILDRIEAECVRDFPDLLQWIEEARQA